MPRFEVKLISGGRARTLEVDAPDVGAARALLSPRGRIVGVRRRAIPTLTPALARNERHILFIRLAAMLESKVGLADALRRIAGSFRGQIKRTAERLADSIETGDDLASAMARLPRDFPTMVIAMIRAGGFGQGTSAALRSAAAFETEMISAYQNLRSGLWVAILYALLGTGLMIGTAHFLTPMLLETEIFRSAREAVDIGWVEVVSDVTTLLALLFLGTLAFLGALRTVGRWFAPRAVERFMLLMPIYRDIALGVQTHIIFYELALLIRGGVGLDRALRLTAEAAPPGALREDLIAASRAVVSGQPWAEALQTVHATDRASLSAAENRAEVVRTLHALSQQHRDLYLHAASIAEPLLRGISIVFLGVAGAVLFGLTILPVLQLSEQISKQAF